MGIGTNLKRLLAIKKMSIKELSEKTGIPVNTLYSITRRDSGSTKTDYLKSISAALGVGIDELISVPAIQFTHGLGVLDKPDFEIPDFVAKRAMPVDIADVAALLTPDSRERLLSYALELAELDRLRDATGEER